MDLSFTESELAFANQAREFLAAHVQIPPEFDNLDDEILWGRAWQARLAAANWVGITWPTAVGGRDATPVQVALFNMEYARSGAPQLVNRVGLNLAGPTLLAHGTQEQRSRWLPSILDASEIWCQLFSEPDAGSDLASLRTIAEPTTLPDGRSGWLVTGQKVWTSYAQYARWGICLARTNTDAPKHRGISYLVIDMEAAGIEIRPLVQITGEAEFNEVFLDQVFVPADHLVGELDAGWAVANTTLAHERGTNFPFKEQVVHEVFLEGLYCLADELGTLRDPEVSEQLATAFIQLRLLKLHNWRTLTRLSHGEEPGPESSYIKLAWTEMTQQMSAAALDVLAESSPLVGPWQRQYLWSMAASIAGGTSEIQKTIIGDRILGLPRS